MGRAGAAVALAALVVLGSGLGTAPVRAAGPAAGGPTAEGTVPPQVQAAYDGDFLRRMVTSTHGSGGQVRAGTVHQLFTFRQEFLDGGSTADPVEPEQAWIAGVELDGVPVGWQQTFLDGGVVQSSGWNPDPVGALPFLQSTESALVEVPSDNAFFSLVDGVVTPVKVQSWDAGLGPRSLAQVQADLAADRAETAAAYACCEPSDGCSGGGAAAAEGSSSAAGCPSGVPSVGALAFASAAVLLAAAVTGTALRQRRRLGAC